MTNQALLLNSSRIKTCEYENCKNQFIRRSNNHKYCKEHEKVNNRKDKLKSSKKRKIRDENDIHSSSDSNVDTENVILSKEDEKEFNNKENEKLNSSDEHNTPVSNSKKPNLLDILMKRTNSVSYNCIGKNKPFHINNIPQKVDKCIQTDDLFEFVPKVKKTRVDKAVGTDNDIVGEPSSPLLDVLTAQQQFSAMLDTPTKNIQSVNSPISEKRTLKNTSEYPLKDISNIINSKYLKSPISDRKSPKFLSKLYRPLDLDGKNKENFNFNVTPIKREFNVGTSYKPTTDSISYLPSSIAEDEIFNFRDKDIFGNFSNFGAVNNGVNGMNNESINNPQHQIPVDYYMEYIKILKKISKFSPSQELKQTLSSNSNLTSINNNSNNNILSPAKTDAEELLNWLNIE
ncbi:hypothetical protein PIROE2DRAFT_57429 [Piromyces sp. E2]|nr:hypothetical protein PIROE2DRAFT_57429 [Piromyces sp. E2]|eukprot:OUM69377.1 hypothetical protein PIROE2DRAFT_57429 [Piromyces sp. E2]